MEVPASTSEDHGIATTIDERGLAFARARITERHLGSQKERPSILKRTSPLAPWLIKRRESDIRMVVFFTQNRPLAITRLKRALR